MESAQPPAFFATTNAATPTSSSAKSRRSSGSGSWPWSRVPANGTDDCSERERSGEREVESPGCEMGGERHCARERNDEQRCADSECQWQPEDECQGGHDHEAAADPEEAREETGGRAGGRDTGPGALPSWTDRPSCRSGP